MGKAESQILSFGELDDKPFIEGAGKVLEKILKLYLESSLLELKRNNMELQEVYSKEIQADKVNCNGYRNRSKLMQKLGRIRQKKVHTNEPLEPRISAFRLKLPSKFCKVTSSHRIGEK